MAAPGVALHQARMANRLAKSVTVYTDGAEELGDQISAALNGSVSGIKVDKSRISKLAKGSSKSEVIMTFEGGNNKTEGFVVRLDSFQRHNPYVTEVSLTRAWLIFFYLCRSISQKARSMGRSRISCP